MKLRAVLSDLDGTLLEPDGSLCAEACGALATLADAGVPVMPVSSKTPLELAALAARHALPGPGGFENGAGVRTADGAIELSAAAVPVDDLRRAASTLREATGVPLRTLDDLTDDELASLTRLPVSALAAVRTRVATLPLVVDPACDAALERALPSLPALRLIRGNRFLQLQGTHDKADVAPRLLGEATGRTGAVVACGDAPNDAGLLELADVAVIVPGADGPCPVLVRRFPNAIVASLPHGRGWGKAVLAILTGRSS